MVSDCRLASEAVVQALAGFLTGPHAAWPLTACSHFRSAAGLERTAWAPARGWGGGEGHTSQPRPLHLLPSLASTGQTVFTADMHRRPCLPQPGPLSGSSKGRTPFTERPWRSRARGEGAVSTVSGAAGRTFVSRGPQRAPLPSSSPLGSPRDRGLVQSHPQKELWL